MRGLRFYTDDDFVGVTPSQLKRISRDRQRDYVRHWFFRNFEDPAEQTPYDSQEGGYLYIWGGPYDAREQIGDRFGSIIDEDRLDVFISEIEVPGVIDWAPGRDHPDQARAADEHREEYPDDDGPPEDYDFAAIEQVLATADVTFGDARERVQREVLEARITVLEAEIQRLRHPHGAIGHNGPALDDDGNPLPDELPDTVAAITETLAVELAKDEPDAVAVAKAATKLQRLRQWCAPRVELAADEFAKELGTWAARSVVAVGTVVCLALVNAMTGVLSAAFHWLTSLVS